MGTRTNIVLDDELIDKAMSKAGVTTKKSAVEAALRDFVREPDWKGLLGLEGSRTLADDYDPGKLFDHGRQATEGVARARSSRYKAGAAAARAAGTAPSKSTAKRK